jgi:alpha-ribazole phosphatase
VSDRDAESEGDSGGDASAGRARFVLVRHTQPLVGAGVCYGRMDLDLAPTWPLDVEQCVARVPAVAHVFTSPSLRCQHLALALGRRDRIEVQVDARLLELDFGAWEGRRWDDISTMDIDRWSADLTDFAPGGGESLRMLWARVLQWRRELPAELSGNIAVVSHHGPLRALAAQIAGQPMEALFGYHIPWGGVLAVG